MFGILLATDLTWLVVVRDCVFYICVAAVMITIVKKG